MTRHSYDVTCIPERKWGEYWLAGKLQGSNTDATGDIAEICKVLLFRYLRPGVRVLQNPVLPHCYNETTGVCFVCMAAGFVTHGSSLRVRDQSKDWLHSTRDTAYIK